MGTALQQHEYNDSKAQIFCIKPYGNTEYFTLSPVYAPEQYVQVSSSTNSDGLKKVELGDGTITDADLFSFQYNSATRDWSIVCKDDSAVCLCISRGDTKTGAKTGDGSLS